MPKILVIIVAISIIIYAVSKLYGMIQFNRCKSCNGLGHWEGTRGDLNQCKACEGSGKG